MAIKRIFVFCGKGESHEPGLDCILHRLSRRQGGVSNAAGLHPAKHDAT